MEKNRERDLPASSIGTLGWDASIYKGIYRDTGSSIGPIDGVYVVGNRLKGFVNSVISTSHDVLHLSKAVDSLQKILRSEDSLTRLSVRTVVRKELIRSEPFSSRIMPHVEAIVPDIYVRGYDGSYAIVYLGSNKQERRASEEDDGRYRRNLSTARQASKHDSFRKIIGQMDGCIGKGAPFEYRVNSQKYDIRCIEGSDMGEHDRSAMFALLSKFGYDRDASESVVSNPNSIKALAHGSSGAACLAVAEISHVPMEGCEGLSIVELTDAIVDEREKGNDLYLATSSYLLMHLIATQKFDVVYGESNLESVGVLKVAYAQGRGFSTDVSGVMGIGRGILEKHAMIKNSLSSLTVTFFDRETIESLKDGMSIKKYAG